jgi:hypothetical protein
MTAFELGQAVNKTLKYSLVVGLVAAAAVACSGSNQEDKKTTPTAVAAVKSNWSYGENVDKMSGEVTKWAMADSINKVPMKFPYNGGSEATIIVYEKNVKIYISKGQVMCSNYSGCTIRVKFDDEKAEDYLAVGPENGQHSYVYLGYAEAGGNGAKKFMDKLKTAKKVMVSLEMYQENEPVWEFNVAGLQQK